MPSLQTPPCPEPRTSSDRPVDERYQAGDLIEGKYRLTRTLGEGGMGVVWVACNVQLDLEVAIKLISLRRGAERSVLRARLLQEARAAAQVVHPAICRTFDFGTTEQGDPYVVSELLVGETLADLLEREPRLPAAQAVQTLLPIADGLAMAHARGIVHCDVKPDNLFLARDLGGRIQPKLLDFGIARFVQGEGPGVAETGLLGTPSYMSPEQVRREPADFRADVWSLCVVLYQVMTGRLPFAGESHNETLARVLSLSPPPTTAAAAGDDALWRILEQGLRKTAAERWSSMRGLRDALAGWLYEHGVLEDLSGTSLPPTWVVPGLESVQILGEDGAALPETADSDGADAEDGDSPRARRLSSIPASLRYLESWSDTAEWRRSRSIEPNRLDVPTLPAPPSRAARKHWVWLGLMLAVALGGLGLLWSLRSRSGVDSVPGASSGASQAR